MRHAWLSSLAVIAVTAGPAAAQFSLIDAGFSGFDYTFGGFDQSAASPIRLSDPLDDSGGAGKGLGGADLSAFADGRFVVDFTTRGDHAANQFLVELIDTAGNGGKWLFSTALGDIDERQQLASTGTLSNPTFGIGDVSQFDLSSINLFQIIGSFTTPAPFDVEFHSAIIDNVPPPPPYAGFELNAPWRAEAATRIDALRKGDLTIRVADVAGAAVGGAMIEVEQTSHEFGFGSAVQAFRLRDNNPVHDTYKQKAAELFNVGTIENNLKWPAWEGEWGPNWTQPGAEAAVAWLEANGLTPRGHVMVWPGVSNLPTDLRNLLATAPLNTAEQQQLRDRIAARIADITGAFAGRIESWDVINEPRTNHDVMDNLSEGDAAMIQWFEQAALADPTAKLYLNEFGILTSAGATNTFNQQLLESQLRALQAGGAPLDGVGLQGHFSDSDLTGPVQLWEIVDRYADLGLDVQITEFDHRSEDEALQAAYLRDFFTAMFAHEAVSEIIQWGFWEDAHFAPSAALFNSDWSIKPNGEAYIDLVFGEWWTDEALIADAAGEASLRGFKGTHEVTITWGGVEYTVDAVIDGEGNVVDMTLPFLLGDYNADGVVDAVDYAVWRETLGEAVLAAGAGADGDGDGMIGAGDLAVWRSRYGSSLPVGVLRLPAPAAGWIVGVACLLAIVRHRSRTASEF